MKSPNICRIISDGIIILGIIIFSVSLLAFGVEPIHPLSILAGTIPWGGYIYGLLTIRCPFCRLPFTMEDTLDFLLSSLW